MGGRGDIESKVLLHRGRNTVHSIGGASPIVYVAVPQQPERSWFPWIIPFFVIANGAVFVLTMYVNDCPAKSENCVFVEHLGRFSFQPFVENPLMGPSASTLDKMGALLVNKVVQGHELWRLITCIWLHGGVFHLVANMFSLLFIGVRLEKEFGFVKIGFLYVLAGFSGSLLSALFIQSNISVGASGALFGLLGAMLSELLTNWTIYANKCAALLTLVFVIAINLAVGILPHVDNFAHIGGFVSGFLLGFVFLLKPQYGYVSRKNVPCGYNLPSGKPKYKIYQYMLLVIALVLLIIGYASALFMLFGGTNAYNHCPWCHYLSCVPNSSWNCKAPNITCSSLQTENQLNLTCLSNGRTKTYPLASANNTSLSDLCTRLCG